MALVDGLVSYWKLDETSGSTAYDSLGVNNGTIYGAIPTTGKINGAYNFDGVNDYINSGSDSSLDNLPAITLSAWIYPITEGEGGLGYILEKSGGDTSGFRFRTQNVGGSQPREIAFRVDYSTTDMYRYSNNNMINLNEWNYVVVTWDGSSSYSNIHIYVNGEEVTYRLNSDGVGTRVSDSSNSLIIGNSADTSSTFKGSIDEVGIWNRALSSDEIIKLYNEGIGLTYPFVTEFPIFVEDNLNLIDISNQNYSPRVQKKWVIGIPGAHSKILKAIKEKRE
jgi:hypothetical protein